MRLYIFAEKDNKDKIVYENDTFNLLSTNSKERFNNLYFQLVYVYVKSRLRKKGDLLYEKT